MTRLHGRGEMNRIARVLKIKENTLMGYVQRLTYVSMAITGLGYLTLLWSTVVLLGGFVSSLDRKDFWCLNFISTVQAARSFNDLADSRFPSFFAAVRVGINVTGKAILQGVFQHMHLKYRIPMAINILWKSILTLCFLIPFAPFVVMSYVASWIYKMGSLLCIVLSIWRIWQRDYGVTYGDGDDSKKNLTPALNVFYSMVVCQGALYFVWCAIDAVGPFLILRLRRPCQFPERWDSECIVDYLFDMQARCWRNPSSIYPRRTIVVYAVELLSSDTWEDYLSGARILDCLIKHGADLRSYVLPSRPKIQKLINTLGWRNMTGDDKEIRELAARIVASLAEDIHLSQFPGAIRCISSLLEIETTRIHGNWQCPSPFKQPVFQPRRLRKMLYMVKIYEKIFYQKVKVQSDSNVQQEEEEHPSRKCSGSNCNELIVQGLTILERLARDHHNCRDICSTPFLLHKIKAPVSSHTMIQDIIKINDWADVVKGCLKVLHRLIRAPAKSGKRLRREISTDKQAVKNLESILYHAEEKAGPELQKLAMEILTDLLLDSSTNLTRETAEKLIKKQLQIFLGDGDEEAETSSCAAESESESEDQLKVTAGRTLALLAASSETYSAFTVNGLDGAVDRLTHIIFYAENKDYLYRTRAVEITEHLCGHSVLEKELVKETLLPKVLNEILSHKKERPESKNSVPARNDEDGNQLNNSVPENDEENQKCSTQGDGAEQHNISEEDGDKEITECPSSEDQENEEQTSQRDLQEAFLSLTLLISDKVISAGDFCDAIEKQAEGRIFVAKLKAIIEANSCKATISSLRIVKLCGQIAITIMRCNRFAEHFRNQEFTKSLSHARKLMSNLESCVLFSETYGGLEKIARPLLSDLEEKALELVG